MNIPGQLQAQFTEAVQLFQRGDLNGAEARCKSLIARDPNFPPAHDVLGNIHLRRGDFVGAEAAFEAALKLNPALADIRVSLASAQLRQQRFEVAEANARQALSLAPGNPRGLSMLGLILRNLKRFGEAVECARQVLGANPRFPPAHAELGAALEGAGRHEEALACYGEALRLAPNFPEAWYAKGKVLNVLERHGEAEVAFRKALELRPDFAVAHSGLAGALASLQRHDEAFAAFTKSVELAPGDPNLQSAFGLWLQTRGRWDEAALCFARALDVFPDFAEAASHLGAVFHATRRLKDAAEAYRRALKADPQLVEAMVGLGALHLEDGRDTEAEEILSRAYAKAPSAPNALDLLVLARLQLCSWDGLDEQCQALYARIRNGQGCTNPFVAMLAGASEEDLGAAARNWAAAVTPFDAPLFTHRPQADAAAGRKLRIGYLSSDLQAHAIGFLTAGIFELHDRQRFELYGYSLGIEDGSPMQRRIRSAFDRFTFVEGMGGAEAARLIQAEGIDILVDLNGYTNRGNPAILAYRPAPIQVNYLGYPGTMGAGFMDYLITDPVTVPAAAERFFSERIVRLPHCYQPNDSRREVAERTPSRAECGLPETGFVFCCFNNPNKITRETFESWMRLLKAVPGSVLWLLDPNAAVKGNLLAGAAAAGVTAERLVFAGRLPLAEHLARHRVADLFLDTLPYNAHTTASDCLWAGLPLLTRMGDTFAGRVAASLLTAVGLPELITTSAGEYEALALRLAGDPEFLGGCRSRLEEGRRTAPLFDTALYTRHLEAAYSRMWEIWQAGKPAEAFSVTP